MKSRILLTGAATLVGAEVLRELLQHPDVASLQLLLPIEEGARTRLLSHLEAYVGSLARRVTIAMGDLRLPRFGLSIAAWDELASSFDVGIHCAQRETTDQNLERARQANLLPVESWIHLLECNPALRLHHLSTGFIGGTRRGLLTEFDLDCGQQFHNSYERSKFEAEVRLRESRVSDRVTIHRPSHTLGRAKNGAAFQLGGAYPLLAALASSSVLPGDGRARIDFVPADYVGAAISSLACSGATGTFHLACGWHASLPVKQAAAIAARAGGRKRGALLLPRIASWMLPTRSLELLHQGPVFDTYLADLALAPLAIARPDPSAWLETAVRAADARATHSPIDDELQPRTEHAAVHAIAIARDDPSFTEKRFHQIGDVNVAYRDIGSGEPVVFLHGFAGAHAWDGVAERIATQRRALIIETLGISDTEGPASADYSLPAQAARVRGLLSALGIASAHIVGNDTGAVIAEFFAVRWPHCTKSLTLSDADAHGTWPPPHVKQLLSLMRIPGGMSLLAASMRVPAIARSSFGFARLVHDQSMLTRERIARYRDTVAATPERRMRIRQFFRAFRGVDVATLGQMLAQLDVPTMVVWGADNAYHSPSYGKRLFDAIPGARRLELIPFAGISCHEERPELFAQKLTEFLDDIEAELRPRHQSSGTSARTSRVYTT
jgi:pimeloyl-ACP methyl ester carboxylesterase/nucleoside-diphosphate-sugar epimerase